MKIPKMPDELEKKRQPLSVPRKSKKLLARWKRRWVLTRNGVRRVRRVKHGIQMRARKFSNYIGEQYQCSICGEMVNTRHGNEHNWKHEMAGETSSHPKRRPPPRTTEPGSTPAPPAPRRPSKVKNEAKKKGRWLPHPGGDEIPDSGTPPKRRLRRTTVTDIQDAPSATRRAWDDNIKEMQKDMAANGNGTKQGAKGVAASGSAAAVVKAFESWANTETTTVAELKAHLLAMDAALGASVDVINNYASQQIIGRKIHPIVAQPISAAAEAMASIRHFFTEAYINFERIYADRLSYERQQGVKPDDKMFSDVG
jgi:hypothetical protein